MGIFDYYIEYRKYKLKELYSIVYKLLLNSHEAVLAWFEKNGSAEFMWKCDGMLLLNPNLKKKQLKELIKFYKLMTKKGIKWVKKN